MRRTLSKCLDLKDSGFRISQGAIAGVYSAITESTLYFQTQDKTSVVVSILGASDEAHNIMMLRKLMHIFTGLALLLVTCFCH